MGLCRVHPFAKLRELDLNDNSISDHCLHLLALGWARGAMAHLATLNLSYNLLSSIGAMTFVNSQQYHSLWEGRGKPRLLPGLEKLFLWRNHIGTAGVKEIAKGLKAGELPKLRLINLNYNDFDVESMEEILAATRERGIECQLSLQYDEA